MSQLHGREHRGEDPSRWILKQLTAGYCYHGYCCSLLPFYKFDMELPVLVTHNLKRKCNIRCLMWFTTVSAAKPEAFVKYLFDCLVTIRC